MWQSQGIGREVLRGFVKRQESEASAAMKTPVFYTNKHPGSFTKECRGYKVEQPVSKRKVVGYSCWSQRLEATQIF